MATLDDLVDDLYADPVAPRPGPTGSASVLDHVLNGVAAGLRKNMMADPEVVAVVEAAENLRIVLEDFYSKMLEMQSHQVMLGSLVERLGARVESMGAGFETAVAQLVAEVHAPRVRIPVRDAGGRIVGVRDEVAGG